MNRKELISRCLTYPSVYEDYPFDIEWTIIRHKGNKKIFALIYERENKLCVNLKCEPIKADFLRQIYKSVTAGYHMNKEHWNTVMLGGDVPDDELFSMIQHSYELTKPKMKKGAKRE